MTLASYVGHGIPRTVNRTRVEQTAVLCRLRFVDEVRGLAQHLPPNFPARVDCKRFEE
jgi:hypothetical protein